MQHAVVPRHGLVASMLAAAMVLTLALTQSPVGTQSEVSAGSSAGPPLLFVPNAGQTDASARYMVTGPGRSFYFTPDKAVLDFRRGGRGVALALRFRGANPHPAIVPGQRTPGHVSYITGSKRHAGLPTYEQLRYRELWPGIDMVFRGSGGTLKYEFLLQPGADPRDIQLSYAGADSVALTDSGALAIATPLGTLRDAAPKSRQAGKPVATRYAVSGSSYGFAVGAYDRSRALTIDPGLVWSTFLGGVDGDVGERIATDPGGNFYVSGVAESADFPTTAGAYDTTVSGPWDVFVTKLTSAGDLVYSTYLGGSGAEGQAGLAVDASGNAYVGGYTTSADFPTTPGSDHSLDGPRDAFVTKLTVTGAGLEYSTFLGGSAGENTIGGLVVDSAGSAYITGETGSTDFPVSAGAPDTQNEGGGDGFVTKMSPTGRSMEWSTFVGGRFGDEARDVAVDAGGNAYVTGRTESSDFPVTTGAYDTSHGAYEDGFVTKIAAAGDAFVYSTLLGSDGVDTTQAITVDGAGNAYVSGWGGADWPTTPGAFDRGVPGYADAFVTKLNATGTGLVYSTFLGGRGGGQGTEPVDIALDSAGSAHVTGHTGRDIPTTPNAVDSTRAGVDAIVMKLNPPGSELLYSTYIGGTDEDFGKGIALTDGGELAIAGSTVSSDYPTTTGAVQTGYAGGGGDAFVTRLQISDGYPRPQTATPMRVSLAVAYKPCAAPNRTHGPPLGSPSCNPPRQASDHLTVGTSDANGEAAKAVGFVRLAWVGEVPIDPNNGDQGDVKIEVSVTDVRKRSDLSDYAGELGVSARRRITDRNNTPQPGTATVQDDSFSFTVPCTPTGAAGVGSTCSLSTTADTLVPGTVKEQQRSIWQLRQIQVYDGGADGDAETAGDNTLFAVQGIFIP